MTTNKLFAAAATTVTAEVFVKTAGRAARLAFFGMFNNIAGLHVTKFTTVDGYRLDGYAFAGTDATAKGIVHAGFDVFVTAPGHFVAVRTAVPTVDG